MSSGLLPPPSCPKVVIGHPSSSFQPIETRENRKEEVPPTPTQWRLITHVQGKNGTLAFVTADYAQARLPTPNSKSETT